MKFLYPEVLFALIPLTILFFYFKKAKKECKIHPKLIVSKGSLDERWLIVAAIFIVISLSRPVIEKVTTQKSFTSPIFIAIDVSNSMMAEDVKPNRFIKAKEIAKSIIKKSPKAALIIFSTNPLLIAPPTTDKEILYQALELIEPKNILTKGTNFNKLLKFVSNFEGEKKLIVISDGGEFKNLKIPKNIELFAVAVGSKSGALIPTKNGYLKNDSKLVVTKINPAFLKVAKAYTINEPIDISFEKENKSSQKKEYLELFFIPLIISIFTLLAIYTTIFERLKKLLPLILVINLNASILDEIEIKIGYEKLKQKEYKEALKYFNQNNLQASYAKALALIKLGNYHKAVQILKSLKSKDKKIKAKILYTLGFAYEKLKRFSKAKDAYIQSAQLYPDIKTIEKIASLAFKKEQKKQPLPFAKQKVSNSKGKSSGKKGGKSSNISISQGGGNSGDKKAKSASINRSKAMPLSSKVYELINKGYIDEKNPW